MNQYFVTFLFKGLKLLPTDVNLEKGGHNWLPKSITVHGAAKIRSEEY
jgi:hypothetical protein